MERVAQLLHNDLQTNWETADRKQDNPQAREDPPDVLRAAETLLHGVRRRCLRRVPEGCVEIAAQSLRTEGVDRETIKIDLEARRGVDRGWE